MQFSILAILSVAAAAMAMPHGKSDKHASTWGPPFSRQTCLTDTINSPR